MVSLTHTKEKAEDRHPRLNISMMGKIFKITTIILACILLVVILALVFFAVYNGYSARYMVSRIFPGTVENIYKPYEIVEVKTAAGAMTAGCDGFVYILDDKNITAYDSKGNEKYSSILDYEDAAISAGADRALIYDRPSGAYIIFKDGEILYDDTIGKTILGAVMQRNGHVVFILKGTDGFLGSALLLNDKNQIIGTYNYSDRFPVSGCITGDSGNFAVAGIYSNDTGKTGIDIFESYEEVPIAGLNRDKLLPLVMEAGKGTFIAAGSENALILDSGGIELASHEFNEIIRITSSAKYSWVADRKTGTDRITCISRSGSNEWVYSTGMATEGICSGERHLFYWAGINAGCIDEKGKPVDMQSGFDQIMGIVDIGNGKIAIITGGSLVFYEYR